MRQRNSKSSAAAGRGYDIDLAVMCLDDFLSDSQAETCTICFVRGKRSKERFKRFGCHAAAIVRNDNGQPVPGFIYRDPNLYQGSACSGRILRYIQYIQ